MDESPVRCLDPAASEAMVAEIDRARKANESLGGVFEVRAFGLVPGIGSHISWEERLDGRLAGAVMSIQAMKGVGIGDGFELAGRVGSQAHDEIFFSDERGFYRETNRAGGLEGGMTTGDPLVVRAAMKPLPTLTKPLRSVDLATKEPAQALRERTDSCTVPAAGVVGEAMVALVLAAAYREKLGRRPHRRREGGAGRLRGAHRVEARVVDGVIVLVGFMGAGKSTGARTLAAELGVEALDSDRELEQRLGEPIEQFFDREGEAAFRAREEEVVCELLARAERAVIALGGGAVQSERVREALGRHVVVHLEIDPGDAWRRASGKGRPLARDPERFAQLQGDRLPVYELVADAVVPPADRDALRRALPFLEALREAPSGTRLVWAAADSGDYPVYLGRGLVEAGFLPPLAGRRFAVTDENVALLQPFPAGDRIHGPRRRASTRRWPPRSTCCARWPRPARSAATSCWRWAAAWWATSPASAPRSTSAACATCRCPPRWWPRSTPPTAARPAWTCPRARTTRASTTSRRRWCAIPRRSRPCRPRRPRPATPRWSRPR